MIGPFKVQRSVFSRAQIPLTPVSIKAHKFSECDLYSGKWVHDDSYPLYPNGECTYMSQEFNCRGNGRNDSDYTKWRWQPANCELPRLKPSEMLERLRGKRLMFVGDSINRNQWESLLCIFSTVVPPERKISRQTSPFSTSFVAQDYNCSIEFFWAPFLVEQGSIKNGNESTEILILDAIEKHGAYWRDVDVLVFNSGHWWTHGNKVQLQNYFMENNYLYLELEPLDAFKKAMITWAKWVDKNIDPTKTRVFFRGFSPTHFSSKQWNDPKGHKCNFEREPIFNESYISPYLERMIMLEKVLTEMKIPVSLMNITRLSDFRKDGHPSVYTMRRGKKLTPEQMNDPDNFGDCSHWCLPGLPDIWNELLYGSLFMKDKLDSYSK
ncbi:hypothetical protein SUGI_0298720 [Cryptomeria japonica]|nr:hypothetical protein SUGI_0298720 [Cryptomeria japonica]